MSIIQSIRDKGAWIIGAVIAIALISFILQDGLNRRGSVFGSSSNIAKVNGIAINRDEFYKKVEQQTQNNSSQRDQIENNVFEQEVGKILLEQEFDKSGIACSDKELNEEMFKPTSQLVQQFKDPKTGIADVEKAKQWYKDFKKKPQEQFKGFVYDMINQTRLVSKYTKYTTFISQSAYAPKWLIDKQMAEQNAFANVSYVAVPYSTISDSTVKVSDEEVINYAKKHHKLYDKTDETRSIQYVSFDALPNDKDSLATKQKIEEKRQSFSTETNMENFFARNVSEMPFYNSHISAGNIRQAIKDTLVKLPVNGVYGPYVDGGNYVLAKLVSTVSMPDSVKVRHILIKTVDQDPQTGQRYTKRDDSTAKHLLDTIVMKINAGSSFDSLCKAQSEDDGSKDKGGVYENFTSGGMVASFNEFSFTKGVGAKGIVKTEYGYHYIEVLSQKGSTIGYKFAYFAKPIILSTETDLNVKREATNFATSVKNRKQFDEEVAKLKKQSNNADNIKKSDFNVGMLGNCKPLVRWVYEKSVGDITDEPQHINNKYVVAIVSEINKPGLPGVQTLRPQVENIVKNEKKAKQIITKFKGNTLESIASSIGNGTVVTKLDTMLATNPYVAIVGNDYKFIGAAFNSSNKGKITEPIAGSSSVFALRTDNIGSKNPTTPQDPAMTKNMLTNTIKSLGNRVTNDLLRKAADIKDNRDEQ